MRQGRIEKEQKRGEKRTGWIRGVGNRERLVKEKKKQKMDGRKRKKE